MPHFTTHTPTQPRAVVLLTWVVSLFLSAASVHAQVWEDFSDGDYTLNPTWLGDTGDFRVNNNHQLQLYNDHADSSMTWFSYTLPDSDTLVWETWMKFTFNPSAQNYTLIHFCSPDHNIYVTGQRLAALICNPGTSPKQIHVILDSQRLILPYLPNKETNTLRMKLEMVRGQNLTIWLDTIGRTDSISYALMGTLDAYDDLPHEAFFSIYCRYTVSRAKNFFFDDIGINRTRAIVPMPPQAPLFPGDLLVNEVLFNPEPGGADYVELYNNTDSTIALSRIRLGRLLGDSVVRLFPIADSGSLAPRQLVAVTTDAGYVNSHYNVRHRENLIEAASMPPYNDDAGIVAICSDDGRVLDRFDYSEKMHSRLLRSVEGVALERRSLTSDTQDPNNWYSAASTAGYGTPTYANSQSREFLFVDDDFVIAPTLFSPDNDGYNDLVDITYRLTECDLSANIDIFDSHGRLVRHLLKGALLGCQGMVSWDGLDESGQRCRPGNYLVVGTAYNTSGTSQSWRRRISLVIK